MKALCWDGKGDVRVDTAPDPKVESPRDAVVKVTSTAICGSDLRLLDGYMPRSGPRRTVGAAPRRWWIG